MSSPRGGKRYSRLGDNGRGYDSTGRYGYVWCPDCHQTLVRTSEVEPLPFCRSCEHFMEPLLCDEPDCEDEAIILTSDGLGFCRSHAVAVAA
jgi:hypothetical protein